ncbi:MAG: ATP-dependent zinc metalloprotease FtsH [Actinomycetota bacterium]
MKKAGSGNTRTLRVLLATLAVLVISFALLLTYAYRPPSVAQELSFGRVVQLATMGQIRSAKLLDEDAVVVGKRCTGVSANAAPSAEAPSPDASSSPTSVQRSPCRPPFKTFQSSYPRSDVATAQLIDRISSTGAEVIVDKQTDTAIIKILVTYIFPLMMLANLFGMIFLARGGDSTMADIAGFGRIKKGEKGKKGEKSKGPSTGVTFADVGGAEEAVVELREVTDYLKDPKKFEAYGASAPKGVLLFGPPGCGKTLLARAVAGEAGVPFFSVSGAEFIESLVGVGAARVRDLFSQVKEVAPAIVFIDEIDAVGRKRSGEGSTGGEREQTVNQLLVELDGFEVTAGIVLMGATNRPDILDPALLRPGRFDRHVTLVTPDLHGRREILELHAKTKPLAEGVDFDHLAKRTAGFTGADLANVINEAALLTIREGGGAEIDMKYLTEAIQRVLHGPQRRGKLMLAEERKRLAYHESGHAVVAAAMGQSTAIQRVSIVATGKGLGSSAISEEADRTLLTTTEMRARLAVAMAGIAAENLIFSEISSISEDDLDKANSLAREMVGILGMSEEVGPLRLLSTEGGYLGSDARVVQAISGQTLGVFDHAVRALIEKAQEAAEHVLAANRHHLDAMSAELEEEETIEGPRLESLLLKVLPFSGFEHNGKAVRSAAPASSKPARKPSV